MMVTQSTLSGNTALHEGGGIDNGGTLTMVNSTLSGNSADNGGGIYNETPGSLTINYSTFSGNSANTGGGLNNPAGGAIVRNSIIANSVAGGSCAGIIYDSGHNISSDDTCGLNPAYGSMPNTDPLLGPLQDNGGPTWTHALLPGSPAIDAGDDAQCPSTDQRGMTRPQDGDGDMNPICDIGSYEIEGALYPQFAPLVIKSVTGPLAPDPPSP